MEYHAALKEGDPTICNSMENSEDITPSKPITDGQILFDSMYIPMLCK